MKKYLFTGVILMFLGVNTFASQTNLEGKYDCQGKEIGTHENYKGIMILTKTGETYSGKSSFEDGSTYTGTGIYDQNKHILSFAFINPKNAAETGVAMADIKDNGLITSTWTYLNKTEIGHSTCIKRTA